MLATPTGSPWSTLLSAPPVYQAKFAGLLRRSAPTPCTSISSRKLRSLDSLLIYVPPTDRSLTVRPEPALFVDHRRNLRPCRWYELVERGLLEPAPLKRLLASVPKLGCLAFRHEGYRTATATRAGETRTPGAVLFRRFYEDVQLGGRNLVVVAQRGVRGVHQTPELVEVSALERFDCFENTGVLGDDVSRAFELRSREETQVLFRGVAQFLDTEHAGRALARRPPVVVAGIGETSLDAGVADDQGQACGLEVERDALSIQRTAVDEQGRTGLTEQRGILVHYSSANPYVVVLGPLAGECEVGASDTEPEECIKGERRGGLDGCRRREPRAERHIPGEGGPEPSDLMSRLPNRPGHTTRIVGPGGVFVVDLARLVEVGGVECTFARPYCDSDAAVDGAGEDEAAVVVCMFPYKVHSARSAGHESGFFAEFFFVRPRRSLFSLSQRRFLLVTVGMVLHPGPGVGDHGLQFRLLGFPAEVGLDLLARGHERGRVPRPPRRLDGGYALACDVAGGFDHLPDGEACPVAEVVDAVLSWLGCLECQQMGAAEVFDVDVVA